MSLLELAFIGKTNETNSIICEAIAEHFEMNIGFIAPDEVSAVIQEIRLQGSAHLSIMLYDINSAFGYGNVPGNIEALHQQFESTPILVLFPYQDPGLIPPLMQAGASGVLPNAPSDSCVKEAVSLLLDGETYIGGNYQFFYGNE